MSKKFIILVIILLFVSTTLATLTYLYKNSAPAAPLRSSSSLSPRAEDLGEGGPSTPYSLPPTPYSPSSTLSFSPNYLSLIAGKSSQIAVLIEGTGEQPTTVQLELAYNPLVLTNLEVTPGDFIPNPNILLNHIDPATGRISYALTTQVAQPSTPLRSSSSLSPRAEDLGEGGLPTLHTLALISFTPLFTGQNSTLLFLPKTAIYANNQKITLKQTQPATMQVFPPPKTATQSTQLVPKITKP